MKKFKMKYLTIFLFVILAFNAIFFKKIESISVVKLSRLNQNVLKKLLNLRKAVEPQYPLQMEPKKSKQMGQKREEEENDRFYEHYYEPRLGILNFYGSF